MLYIFTHDSTVGLGERPRRISRWKRGGLIPANVWQLDPTPAASSAGWDRRCCLSRQNTAVIARDASHEALIRRGGFISWPKTLKPALVLIATGSEVGLALGAQKALAADGIKNPRGVNALHATVRRAKRRISRWCFARLPKLAIEAGVTGGWWKYVHGGQTQGAVLGIDSFGESAPAGVLMEALWLRWKRRGEGQDAGLFFRRAGTAASLPAGGAALLEIKAAQRQVGINGYGHQFLCALWSGRTDIEIVAINDLGDSEPTRT